MYAAVMLITTWPCWLGGAQGHYCQGVEDEARVAEWGDGAKEGAKCVAIA